jgi:hypothetical protein
LPPVGRLAVFLALASLALALAARPTLASRLPGPDPVIATAGDISCAQEADGSTNCRDQATSDLLVDQGLARVLTLGDNQYESGALSAFNSYYSPTWGRVKEITSPSPGNHDPFSSGYSGYFGSRAPARYYSYDIGQWHLISLDSNTVDSAQVSWLRSDLAVNAGGKCVLAYWHHPRFSSGTTHGNSTRVVPFWTELYKANADLVLSGHEHNYERFAPQDPNGTADSARGIREFVVGTGGKSHYGFGAPQPNSEVRSTGTFGVLELALRPGAYEWLFVPEAGKSFSDSGTGVCHRAGYTHPKGAAPLRVALVPTYRPCEAPNRTHGSPLAFASCGPPQQTSGSLTIGSPDSNGKPANSLGFVRLDALLGTPSTPADEADVQITTSISDVREDSTMTDYTGEVQTKLTIRLTDRASGGEPQTTEDFPFRVTVPCTTTSSTTIGSTCALTTTADSVLPGAVPELRRSIWALDKVDVYDGGSDSDADTLEDNGLFATQGVFVP